MDDNKDDWPTPPLPDVPPEVNVQVKYNDKPLPQEPTHTKPPLCAAENSIDEPNPSAVLPTPKPNSTDAADLAKLVANNQ